MCWSVDGDVFFEQTNPWVATESGILRYRRLAPEDVEILSDSLVGMRAHCVSLQHGEVWAGSSGGLSKWNADGSGFTNRYPGEDGPSGMVNALQESSDGTLWIGTAGGLDRLDRETGVFTRWSQDPEDPASLPDNTVLSVFEDARGRLWAGTYGGLARLDPGAEAFVRFTADPEDPESLANNYVYTMHQSGDGTLWIGTAGGLDRWEEETGTFTHVDRNAGHRGDHHRLCRLPGR